MFEDPACPYCRRWHAEVGVSYHATEEGRIAPLRRVDIKDRYKAGVSLKGPVTFTPTFVLAEDGREVGRIVGYSGADFFYGFLANLLEQRASSPARTRGLSR
jgi:protein-disulfide isomerase